VTVSETIEDARRLIEGRLEEIWAETCDLDRGLVGLGKSAVHRPGRRGHVRTGTVNDKAGCSASTKVASKKRPPVPVRKATERVARGERREQLLAAIKASPGARPSELAEEIGIRPTQVSVLIAKLRGERLLVKDGNGYALRP
jgi:hypothetical protein